MRNVEGTVKKGIDRKKLVLNRQTVRELQVQDLDPVVGGMMDPTLGVCGNSKGGTCPSQRAF
jgi:hypothetical protein